MPRLLKPQRTYGSLVSTSGGVIPGTAHSGPLPSCGGRPGWGEWAAQGAIVRGWALAEQNRVDEGIAQTRQGLEALQATGAGLDLPRYLTLLAESFGRRGQMTEGRKVLAEALAIVNRTGERYWEAELYRLQGELTFQQSKVQSLKSKVNTPHSAFRNRSDKFKVQGSRFKVATSPTPNTQHPRGRSLLSHGN